MVFERDIGRGERKILAPILAFSFFTTSTDKSAAISWHTQYYHIGFLVTVTCRGSPCPSLTFGTNHIIEIAHGHTWSIATIEVMKNLMPLSPRCVAFFRRSRTLVILVDQLVIVELGMPNLFYCATPAVPELGGKGMRKNPSSCSRMPRLDPRTSTSEIIADPSVGVIIMA
jgi:hypothetical protein